MTEGLRVTIAGLDFYGQGPHEFVISPNGFEGWDDGVDMRLDGGPRQQAHGSFDLPGFQDARTVSVSGYCFADSSRELAMLRSRLTGVLAGGQPGRIQVERLGDTQWADGRLASKTKFTEHGGQGIADFQIQLWCPDPRKFGDLASFPVSAGVSASLHHRGNYDATPLIRVHGPTAAYTITGPAGEQYTVTGGLGSGNEHVIDFNDGLLRVNGAITAAAVTKAELWRVPAGQKVTATLSAGNGHIEVLDTYI